MCSSFDKYDMISIAFLGCYMHQTRFMLVRFKHGVYLFFFHEQRWKKLGLAYAYCSPVVLISLVLSLSRPSTLQVFNTLHNFLEETNLLKNQFTTFF